jgi:hypothetical protein
MAGNWGGRRPGSGRPRGSLNKRTQELVSKLDAMGADPVTALARVAQHAEAVGNLDLAERCWRGLLPYAGPRPTVPRESFSAPEKGLPAEGTSRSEKTPASAIPRRGTS